MMKMLSKHNAASIPCMSSPSRAHNIIKAHTTTGHTYAHDDSNIDDLTKVVPSFTLPSISTTGSSHHSSSSRLVLPIHHDSAFSPRINLKATFMNTMHSNSKHSRTVQPSPFDMYDCTDVSLSSSSSSSSSSTFASNNRCTSPTQCFSLGYLRPTPPPIKGSTGVNIHSSIARIDPIICHPYQPDNNIINNNIISITNDDDNTNHLSNLDFTDLPEDFSFNLFDVNTNDADDADDVYNLDQDCSNDDAQLSHFDYDVILSSLISNDDGEGCF